MEGADSEEENASAEYKKKQKDNRHTYRTAKVD